MAQILRLYSNEPFLALRCFMQVEISGSSLFRVGNLLLIKHGGKLKHLEIFVMKNHILDRGLSFWHDDFITEFDSSFFRLGNL